MMDTDLSREMDAIRKRYKSVPASEARSRLKELLHETAYRRRRAIITQHGKPVAALVPISDLIAMHEVDRKAFDELSRQVPRDQSDLRPAAESLEEALDQAANDVQRHPERASDSEPSIAEVEGMLRELDEQTSDVEASGRAAEPTAFGGRFPGEWSAMPLASIEPDWLRQGTVLGRLLAGCFDLLLADPRYAARLSAAWRHSIVERTGLHEPDRRAAHKELERLLSAISDDKSP